MLKPKIAPTSLNVSDKVQDLSIIHAINLERLKQDEVVKVLDILDDLGLSIQKQLEKIDPTGVGPTYRARRLAKLLQNVKATTKAHFSKAKAANSKGLSGVASVSAKATQNIVNGSLGVSLGAALPSAATLQSLAGKVLIEGDVVSEYWKQQNAQVTGNFLRQMRMGVAGGEGLQSLIQRVRGTKENNFTDGIMNATKKKAETLVRSSVAAVNNEAIIKTYQANEDLFNGYQWMATLDSRTSDICKARSGLTWDKDFQPVGHGIGWSAPPAHFNCRSTVIGVLKPWSDLANKPLPAVGAETLKEELTKSLMARGLSPALISKAINKTQQSMDGFVAGDINFEDWLKGKTERFQKAILGDQKWELWNTGKIGFVDLVDQKSHPRSLAELQALVDQGRTSPLKANKAAKEAAKQQAEAAALATKAAEKAENAAQAQIDEIASGSAGANKKKVYDKLKKDGIDGLSATQVMAKIDEGVAQIDITANIAKAKKKLKDGKPLSKTEDAAWATVDDDLKAAFVASLQAESAIFKTIDGLISEANTNKELLELVGGDTAILGAKKAFSKAKAKGQDHLVAELDAIMSEPELAFVKTLKGFDGLDSLIEARKLPKIEAEKFVDDYKKAKLSAKAVVDKQVEIEVAAKAAANDFVQQQGALKALMLGDPDQFDFTKYAVPKDIEGAYIKLGPKLAKEEADFHIYQHSYDIKSDNEKITAALTKQTDEATEYLSKAKEGGTGFSTHKVAYDNLSKSGGLTGDAIADAAKVQAEKDVIQAAKSLAAMKTKIKKKFKANKPLAPKEQEAFDSLSADDQDLLKEAASAGKTAKQLDDDAAAIVTQKATQRADEGVLFEDLEQIGGQGGSNVGGTFKSKIDGQDYYIKAPRTDDHAKNELLGIRLYQMLGIETPDVNFIRITGKIGDETFDNKLGISSKIIDDMVEDGAQLASGKIKGVADGFGADAWLANWDVVGLSYDNLKILNGRAIRIEAGGALRYRARGSLKSPWNSDVPEIDSLRQIDQNAEVFSGLSEAQIVESVRKVTNTSDQSIREVVESVYGAGDDIGEELISTLLARREALRARFKVQLEKVEKKEAAARFTDQEAASLVEARVNGYSIKADKDLIEDQNIHLTSFTDEFGDKKTRMFLKVRGSLAEKLDNQIKGSVEEVVDLENLENSIEAAVRSFNAKVDGANDGALNQAWSMYSMKVERYFEEALADARQHGDEYVQQIKKRYDPIIKKVSNFGVGDKPTEKFDFFNKLGNIKIKSDKIDDSIFGPVQKRPSYYISNFKDSFQEQSDETFSWQGRFASADSDDLNIRYFPRQIDELAVSNRLEIEFDGSDAKSIANAISSLEKKLGASLERPSKNDLEELYLRKIAYRFAGEQGDRAQYLELLKHADNIGDQEERLKALARAASKLARVSDIRKLPKYDPQGDWQFGGHGRTNTFFPHMDANASDQWADVYDKHYIWHDLEFGGGDQEQAIEAIIGGGGQMVSTTERLKRGLRPSGASPEEDTRTGGASYVFTRLWPKDKMLKSGSNKGLFWKSQNHYRRTDALHYNSDKYGRQKFDNSDYNFDYEKNGYREDEYANYQKAVSASDAESFARGGSNEVIFKESLSIFDDLLFMLCKSRAEQKRLIAFVKSKGYKTWPDGRRLDNVFVTEDDAEVLGYLVK